MENIKRLLREAKISQSYKGYQYLLHAIRLVAENETRLCRMREEVYQKIAEMFHDNYRNVEKDIRTIRDKFWNSQGQLFLEKITGSKIDDKPYPRGANRIFCGLFEGSGPVHGRTANATKINSRRPSAQPSGYRDERSVGLKKREKMRVECRRASLFLYPAFFVRTSAAPSHTFPPCRPADEGERKPHNI